MSTPITYSSGVYNYRFGKTDTRLTFGQKITIAEPGADNPWDSFVSEIGKHPAKYQLPPQEKVALHEKIIQLIRELQSTSGPISPQSSRRDTSAIIAEQSTSIPPTLPAGYREMEYKARLSEFEAWKLAAQAMSEKFSEAIKILHASTKKQSSESLGFNKLTEQLNSFLAQGTTIDVNTEAGELDRLVNSDQATIFTANHPNPPHDLPITFAFLSHLYKQYSAKNKNSAPSMKYVLTERISNSMPPELQHVLKTVQAVGVDATVYPTAERAATNGAAMKSVVAGFAKDKNHIFIFPEGGRPRYQNELSFPERYQYGIGKMILNILQGGKPEVKVLGLGMTKNNVLNIGSSLYFKKWNNQIWVAKENSTTGERIPFAPIQHGNSIVEIEPGNKKAGKLMSRLIAGLTCDELNESITQAKLRDPQITPLKATASYNTEKQSSDEILSDVSKRLLASLEHKDTARYNCQEGFIPIQAPNLKPQGEFLLTYSDKGPKKFRLFRDENNAELQKLEAEDTSGKPLSVNVLNLSNQGVSWHTVQRNNAAQSFSAEGLELSSKTPSIVKGFNALFDKMSYLPKTK